MKPFVLACLVGVLICVCHTVAADDEADLYTRTTPRKNHQHHNRSRKKSKHTKSLLSTPANLIQYNEEADIDSPNLNAKIRMLNLTAKVGDTVVLNCGINASYGLNPGVIWMQGKLGNVLTLNLNRITTDGRFEITQTSQPMQAAPNRTGLNSKRQSVNQKEQQPFHFNYYHLRINNVQVYDENEYACETTLTRRSDDQPSLHSLIYLRVTRKNILNTF